MINSSPSCFNSVPYFPLKNYANTYSSRVIFCSFPTATTDPFVVFLFFWNDYSRKSCSSPSDTLISTLSKGFNFCVISIILFNINIMNSFSSIIMLKLKN